MIRQATAIGTGAFTAAYGPDGLRVVNHQLSGAGSTIPYDDYTLYDGDVPLVDYFQNANGSWKVGTAFAADGLRATMTVGTSGYTEYSYDPQGNLAVADDVQSSVHHQYPVAFSPYGFQEFGSDSFAVGFSGQYGARTDPTGYVLMTNRYFDPYRQRFLNRDPIGYNGGINLYAYAGNDPINHVDPSGLAGVDPSTGQVGPPGGGWPDSEHGERWIPRWARVPRPSSTTLRANWSSANGGKPAPTTGGKNDSMAHTRALSEGGDNSGENLTGKPEAEHSAEHVSAGDFRAWAAARIAYGAAKKEGLSEQECVSRARAAAALARAARPVPPSARPTPPPAPTDTPNAPPADTAPPTLMDDDVPTVGDVKIDLTPVELP